MNWETVFEIFVKAVVVPVGSYLLTRWLKSSGDNAKQTAKRNRMKIIQEIAEIAFNFVEGLAASGQLPKNTVKWTEFVEQVTNAMLASGMGMPTGPEMKWLGDYARSRAAGLKVMHK